MRVFIDTGAFCALSIPKDRHNSSAKQIHKQLKAKRALLYTSDYGLDEVYTLLKVRGSHHSALIFMARIESTRTSILRVSIDMENAAKDIFRRFDDPRLSFTDCTSFALINKHNIDAVFAFDKHFSYHPYSHPVEFLG